MQTFSASVLAFLAATITAQADAPRVATDIAPIHSLVAQVMEGVGTPDLLMQPGVSPHGYSLRPSEARALQDADLVVWIGPKLTPSLKKTIESLAADAHSLALLGQKDSVRFDYRGADDFEVSSDDEHDHGHDDDGHDDHAHEDKDHDEHDHDEHGHDDHDDHDEHGHEDHDEHDDHGHDDHAESGHDDHGHDDHSDGDDHGHEDGHNHEGTDSHAWLDPQNARIWLGLIAEELSEIDPENAATYAENSATAQAELAVLEAEIADKLAPVQAVKFVVFHDAYQYFEKRFGLKAAGALRDVDGMAASAARLREVRATLQEHNVQCIFSEPQFPDAIVASVAEGLDLHTTEVDPLGATQEAGASLYGAMLSKLADDFASCLSHAH